MNLTIVGTGYVGLVTGICFSEYGNNVVCVDTDSKKIRQLNNAILPIYEPGLEDMFRKNKEAGRLIFTDDIQDAVKDTEFCFISVGTPPGENGAADLQYVIAVAKALGRFMEHHIYIVDKSTVPVGTAEIVRKTVQKELDHKESDLTFDVISNPEFLKEGSAIGDCMRPDRIVIGTDNPVAEMKMRKLYKPFLINTEAFITMDIRSAELTKYAANAMLATKISFMNELANISERVGADINKVRMGIGSDKRIGYSFIYPGCGYGGSCFPKDVTALIKTAEKANYYPQLLQAVEHVNLNQKQVLVQKVIKRFGEDLNGKTFAVWGLSFKPDTDDMRESTAITVIRELIKRSANIKAYDPKAMQEAQEIYLSDLNNIVYVQSKYTALEDADALLLITEWKEFRSPDFYEMGHLMKNRVIIDGRNQYDKDVLLEEGFEYFQIGVGEIE